MMMNKKEGGAPGTMTRPRGAESREEAKRRRTPQ